MRVPAAESGRGFGGSGFSNADLSEAVFFMADLRGARLDGANLKDAWIYLSVLDDATFEGATFSNTEVTGSVFSAGAFTASQRNAQCASQGTEEGRYLNFQAWYNEDFGPSDGVENLLTFSWSYQLPPTQLGQCSTRSDDHRGGHIPEHDLR